ncbi:MAG: dynamin family protein [Clostridia bacterium]|nr:dynamin family protein [Clostridia bacterium]
MSNKKNIQTTDENNAAAQRQPNLADYSAGLRKIAEKEKEKRADFVQSNSPENAAHLKGIRKNSTVSDTAGALKTEEAVLAVEGAVSGGKSSFLNVICRYPILPAAKTTTSTCPVEIRYTDKEADERIEVCSLSSKDAALSADSIKTFRKQRFDNELFAELLLYARMLVDKHVLRVTDTLDFFKKEDKDGGTILNPDTWRHTMFLLMLLLDTYVHQDKQGMGALSQDFEEVNIRRNRFLEQFGIPKDEDYGIRLFWHSEDIPRDTVLVDLPGTGSATVDNEKQITHDKLVARYTARASSLIFLFNENATIESVAQNNLDSFIETNKPRMSPTRLILVMNKADMLGNNDSVATTLNNFRQDFAKYNAFPVYAISAWAGERYFIDEGIPLENLHASADELEYALRRNKPRPSQQDLEYVVNMNLESAYPFQIKHDDKIDPDAGMNLPTFIKTFFRDLIARLHMLNIIEEMRLSLADAETFGHVIDNEINQLNIAGQFGAECAKELSEVIAGAMRETADELNNTFTKAVDDIQKSFLEVPKKLRDDIIPQFDGGYERLNNDINGKLQKTIDGLSRNNNGSIPVGPNAVGKNKEGIDNKNKIIEFAKTVADMNFISYFRGALARLNEEFEQEYKFYKNAINSVIDVLRCAPNRFELNMKERFEELIKHVNIDENNKDLFRNAIVTSTSATASLLKRVCDSHADNLARDSRIEKTIDETRIMVQEGLMSGLSIYLHDDFGEQIISKIVKNHWFRADTIDQTALTNLLSQHYIDDFKQGLEKTLKDVFFGAGTSNESHVSRMGVALDKVRFTHLSREATKDLNEQVLSASDVTEINFTSPTILAEWKKALEKAVTELAGFFDDESAYAVLLKTKTMFDSVEWAKNPLETACGQAAAAKEKYDQIAEKIKESDKPDDASPDISDAK